MPFTLKNLTINKLSVIGAGQIGPDICLHFAKVFYDHGVELILVDISETALANAKTKIEKKIAKGEQTGAFKPNVAEAMRNSITYTTDYKKIAGSNIVLEAATEDERIKDIIFKQVESLTDDTCLFFSNSSHMQPEVIFKNIANKSRTLVTHYFFPAEQNPVVEIVPGAETDPKKIQALMGFYEAIGKVPILVKSSYGYAIDPIFEGLCELAILCLEKGYGTVKEIDKIAQKVLHQGVGPFTALNLTGGNPITNHGLDEMNKTHIPWFRSPLALQQATEKGIQWHTAQRGELVEVDAEKSEVLRKQLLGGYFALASYIIGLGITNVNDLDMATEIALVISPPFSLMNKIGINEAYNLVQEFCKEHTDFPFPIALEKAKQDGGWKVSNIVRSTQDNVAILTIRRPKVLNALNLEVLDQLTKEIEIAEKDNAIQGIVITGFGVKAFISGADINWIAAVKTPIEGYNNSHTFQSFIDRIEQSKKIVLCAMNGFAFGGGNELAMACTARIAKKGLRTLVCQPEVNLGIIPGAGGTQRLPRLVGVEKAAEILRTAKTVSSQEALEIGLIDKEVEGDLIDEAVKYLHDLLAGKAKAKKMVKESMVHSQKPQELNIGHLSKKIDSIITRAIYDGIGMSLQEGLDFESRLFGECVETEDMKIGLENFKTNGVKAKAEFVHK